MGVKNNLIIVFILIFGLFVFGCEIEEEKKDTSCPAVCISNETFKEGWYDNCTQKRYLWDYCLQKDKTILRTPSNCPSGIIGYKSCDFGWAEIQSRNGCKRIFCLGDFTLGPRDIIIRGEVFR